MIAALAPALAFGNTVVLVPSEPFPLAATEVYQVLDTSDVPAGVANIVTGDHAALAPTLAAHMDVDALWSFSGRVTAAEVERASAANLKRTWVASACDGEEARHAATTVQTIWLPAGEG
jgi:aldehyde dehydrogenase (NAD+)